MFDFLLLFLFIKYKGMTYSWDQIWTQSFGGVQLTHWFQLMFYLNPLQLLSSVICKKCSWKASDWYELDVTDSVNSKPYEIIWPTVDCEKNALINETLVNTPTQTQTMIHSHASPDATMFSFLLNTVSWKHNALPGKKAFDQMGKSFTSTQNSDHQ